MLLGITERNYLYNYKGPRVAWRLSRELERTHKFYNQLKSGNGSIFHCYDYRFSPNY